MKRARGKTAKYKLISFLVGSLSVAGFWLILGLSCNQDASGPSSNMISDFIKRRATEGRRSCGDRSRGWSAAAISQGTSRLPDVEEARRNPPRDALGEHSPADTFISGFWPPELWEKKFLMF